MLIPSYQQNAQTISLFLDLSAYLQIEFDHLRALYLIEYFESDCHTPILKVLVLQTFAHKFNPHSVCVCVCVRVGSYCCDSVIKCVNISVFFCVHNVKEFSQIEFFASNSVFSPPSVSLV